MNLGFIKKFKSYLQLSKLSQAILLEEADPVRLIYISVVSVAVLLFLLLIWAALITVDETAKAYGEVVPYGPRQVVQHLEGGVVGEALVQDGDVVKKGQRLLIMDEVARTSELKQLQSREVSLILDQARLQAYVDEAKADPDEWIQRIIQSKYNPFGNKKEIAKSIMDEMALLDLQNKKRHDQREVILAQIRRHEKGLKQLEKDHKILKENLGLYMQEYNMYQQLSNKDIISKRDFLIIQRRINTARGEESRLITDIEKNKQSLTEAKGRLKEVESSLREEAMQELDDINAQLLEVRQAIAKQSDRVKRLIITAPVNGTVKGLQVTEGSVVQPGGELMDIVPTQRQLVVEARVSPRDIGHIKIGDPVKVKVLTYDFARYGSILGKLKAISASTFSDEHSREPYYKATIELERTYFGEKADKEALIPGMTVEADIITGQRSLLTYLLTPIKTSVESSFHER